MLLSCTSVGGGLFILLVFPKCQCRHKAFNVLSHFCLPFLPFIYCACLLYLSVTFEIFEGTAQQDQSQNKKIDFV
ncbi:uncharacterized protein EV154DRAFT_505077 [Mucor mucedo]|uniref:uncharacterized protein n=1 Tax=Mucor mucedo TaxID=29922 RepID=UPI00221E84DF|nr:uncharacterized protein EV154DRAFT_505077 [Mucor mucedo]KAI7892419.1 hypothetical protein EV154DRAFT_505077 [Mucor mucedo]